MKILRVIRTLDISGGGPMEGIRQISPHLTELGVSSTVVSLDPPDAPWLQHQPFDAIGLGPVASGYGYKRGLPTEIRKLASMNDVVIIHGLWEYHSLATWRALRGTRIPYFVYTHGMLDPWFKKAYPVKHLKKWIYWPWADYRVVRDATRVLFTTEREKNLASQSFWLYEAREHVMGYGTSAPPVEFERHRQVFLDRFPELQDKRIFLFLSRIHPKKGIDLLIESFAAIASTDSSLHLVIAGPDQVGWKVQLKQQAQSLGISDRLTWTGMLSGELKWGAFCCAELFCLPSHQENFGISVAEALACGLPVAISEPVNISSEVVDGKAGIVHKDTVDGTTEALHQWLTLLCEDKRTMGINARKLFRDRYDFASVAKDLFEVLQLSLDSNSSPCSCDSY